MVEGETKEVSEDDFLGAVKASHEAIVEFVALQEELIAEINPEKRDAPVIEEDEEFNAKVVRDGWQKNGQDPGYQDETGTW